MKPFAGPVLGGMLLVLPISLVSCVSPLALHRAVMAYDRAVSRVELEMLLLNIARARYHRPLHFTAVSSVAATFDFRANLGFTAELFEGVPKDLEQSLTKKFFLFELGGSAAENPTVNIIPIQGEEFTKRILTPMDEAKFWFLFHRGLDPAMMLRLMARSVIAEAEGAERPTEYHNNPRVVEEYKEFRKRTLHLSALNLAHQLYVGPLVYEEIWPLPLEHPLTSQALGQGYRWHQLEEGRAPILNRQVMGRLALTNYDPAQFPNEERRRLHEEAELASRDNILVDIRPGFPGGDYPLHGRIQFRSFQAALAFVAQGIVENPEFVVEKDPRTGPVPVNPAQTLEILETATRPAEAAAAVEFEGRWYSIPKGNEGAGSSQTWNLDVFRAVYQMFQLTVTDVGRVPTFPITISK